MTKQRLFRCVSFALVAMFACCEAADSGFAYTPPAADVPTCTTDFPGTLSTSCTDYFGVANYANSPLPAGSVDVITVASEGSGYSTAPAVTISDPNGSGATATATVVGGVVTEIMVTAGGTGYIAPQVTIAPPAAGTIATATAAIGGTLTGGIRKFVDRLPGLGLSGCTVSSPTPGTGTCNENGLGQYIPVAAPDNVTFPGSNYYVIGLSDHREKMHSDLPTTTDTLGTGTRIRGYYQINGTDHSKHYLGPLILATKNLPVRVRFENHLGTGNAGDLFIPVDTTYMGAGMGPLRPAGGYYSHLPIDYVIRIVGRAGGYYLLTGC